MTVNPTAVWRVRPSGSNVNGGGFDPAISGAGTDYSQQDTAQLLRTDIACSNTTTVTSATGGFTTAMIGNAMWITGGGATSGAYFITARASTNSITVDRAPGTVSGGAGRVGGAWADFLTNTTTAGPLVPGNTTYIWGGSTPSISIPDYTCGSYLTPPNGNTSTGGMISFVGDPSTPSNNGFGGKPVILTSGILFYSTINFSLRNVYIVAGTGGSIADYGTVVLNSEAYLLDGVIFDQNGWDMGLTPGSAFGGGTGKIINCEVFSSSAKRSTNAYSGLPLFIQRGPVVINCNIHDCIGPGAFLGPGTRMIGCIVAKNGGMGLKVIDPSDAGYPATITNCTIDGNATYGIELTAQACVAQTTIVGNLITNNITYGITVDAGTTAQNDRVKQMIDYNSFYNNGAHYNAISAGIHDVALSSDPYVGQSTQNYKLA